MINDKEIIEAAEIAGMEVNVGHFLSWWWRNNRKAFDSVSEKDMPLNSIIKELKIKAGSYEEVLVTAAYKNCMGRLAKIRSRKGSTNVDSES